MFLRRLKKPVRRRYAKRLRTVRPTAQFSNQLAQKDAPIKKGPGSGNRYMEERVEEEPVKARPDLEFHQKLASVVVYGSS